MSSWHRGLTKWEVYATIVAMNIKQYLAEQQQERNLNDHEFAKQLQIPRATWQAIRTGRRNIGTKTLQAILKVYPKAIIFFD